MFNKVYIVEITLLIVLKVNLLPFFCLQIMHFNYRSTKNELNTKETITCNTIIWRWPYLFVCIY